ncbi:lipid IV(A) 3-deoxy-D-manno-octulosonic acid transferase [Sulfurimonas sp.]|nr:lipid IV(A) 3-deoxy-D-manno-octulosonic acid transferase [Sulfurimonas sp.]
MKPFTLLYSILSVVLYIVALPLLVYLSLKPKYKESIPSRFFLLNNPRFKTTNGIWFHVCSFGEAGALKPILKLLGDTEIKISTISQTGFAAAKKYDADVRYLPYEMFLPFWAKKQDVLVVLEAEFWYLLFTVLKAKGARVILLNARIPDNSVKKYLQMAWFYKRLLAHVEIVYAQSDVDKNRFIALGARNVEVIGNIKLAGEIVKTKDYEKPEVELIVAGSTHPTEEEMILKSFVEYRKQSDAKLVVVPRHPERFEDVYKLMQEYADKADLTLEKFSVSKKFDTDMVLVDSLGELNNIYAISDIAILGGAFVEGIGGHNPLEPAKFGCKIITGKHFPHQKELFKYVHHVQYVEPSEIHKALLTCRELPESMVEEEINLGPVIKNIIGN